MDQEEFGSQAALDRLNAGLCVPIPAKDVEETQAGVVEGFGSQAALDRLNAGLCVPVPAKEVEKTPAGVVEGFGSQAALDRLNAGLCVPIVTNQDNDLFVLDKACEAAGPAVKAEFDGKMQTIKIGEYDAYVVGTPSENAILVIYDIFAWNERNLNVFRICHMLASQGHFVVMPDFYKGKPWPIEQFPPPNKEAFNTWWTTVADVPTCGKAMKDVIIPWMQEQGVKSIGSVGFCWGGLCALTHAKSDMVSAAVSIHGARLTPELVSACEVPVAIMPGCGDGDFRPLQQELDKKSFGSKCFYRKYMSGHGFCVSRGDWNVLTQKEDAEDAVACTLRFLSRC